MSRNGRPQICEDIIWSAPPLCDPYCPDLFNPPSRRPGERFRHASLRDRQGPGIVERLCHTLGVVFRVALCVTLRNREVINIVTL